MNNETPTTTEANSESDTATRYDILPMGVFELFTTDAEWDRRRRKRIVISSGLLALIIVAVGRSLDILWNLPFNPVGISPVIRNLILTGVPILLAFTLVIIAFAAEQSTVRVGLLFVGIFGLLPIVDQAATVPALVAVSVGGAVVLLATPGWPSTYQTLRKQSIAVGLLAGIMITLSSSIGIVDGGLRNIGTLLTLGAVTALVVWIDGDRIALLIGLFALIITIVVSVMKPYIVGSVLLIAFAVVGVSHLLIACAIGGAVAATVAGLRRQEYTLSIGALLVLLAGIPGTFPRALAVIFGATLIFIDVDIDTHPKEYDRPSQEGPA